MTARQRGVPLTADRERSQTRDVLRVPPPGPSSTPMVEPGYLASRIYFWCPGPVVQVWAEDGVLVEFRPGSDHPQHAYVKAAGVKVRGTALDIDTCLAPDGSWSWLRLSKTGIAGVNGGDQVPATTRDAALALARRRAREARKALGLTRRAAS